MMVALASLAWAATPVEQAQLAELEKVRGEVADQVQLAAYDLVDELVYGWTNAPVFEQPSAVVLAQVTVPVGLGTGLQAMVENHLSAVLRANPSTNVQLVHCPSCGAVVVHSGPDATVISRGIDDPTVLAEIGAETGRHALFVDIEAEGAWLVLRARITQLTPELPIVWSHTIASEASAPSLLREATNLVSASEARAEYLAALRDRGPITIPLRFGIRTYRNPQGEGAGIAPPPFLWLQSGVELGMTRGGGWLSSLVLGYSFIPQAYQGILAQGRISRLVSGRVRSITHPDLYIFGGGAVMTVWGPATAPFRNEVLNADELISDLNLEGPRTSMGAFQIGVDLRLGGRIGLATFLETIPGLTNSPNLGAHVRILGVEAHALGTEVTFCF